MSGALFLGIVTLICIGLFLNGLRFARMTTNPWAGKKIGPFAVEGSELPVSSVRQIGRIQMIGAQVFWLFSCLLAFGLLGSVEGIHIISL